MLSIARHTKVFGSVAAVVFALGTSGVAFVMHSCTMTPVMECCQNMSGDTNTDCSGADRTAAVPSFQLDITCNATTIIGGFTTNPAIVENGQQAHKASFVIVPVSANVSCLQTLSSSVSIAPLTEGLPPPSVEKYILNASLLI